MLCESYFKTLHPIGSGNKFPDPLCDEGFTILKKSEGRGVHEDVEAPEALDKSFWARALFLPFGLFYRTKVFGWCFAGIMDGCGVAAL